MKKVPAPVVLLLCAVFVRVAFYLTAPGFVATADTLSYYATARNIVATHIVADQWRTPGYPLFLALPFILTGKQLPETYYGRPMPEFVALMIVQSLAGVISVLLLYKILRDIGVKRKLAWVLGIFVACDWSLLAYERILLTETLSLLLLVATVFFMVSAMRRWHAGKGIALGALFIIGVLLRPSTIVLPFLFICFLVWYHRKRAVVAWSIMSLVLYAGVLATYSGMNARYFSYSGISRISDVNLLGKILSYRLSPERMPPGEIKTIVSAYIRRNETDPWAVYQEKVQLYEARYAVPMHNFVTKVLERNIGTYILRSLTEIPRAITGSGDTDALFAGGIPGMVNRYIRMGYMLFFVGLPVSLYALGKKKTLFTAGMALFSGIGLYYVATAVFLSYNDYSRLILPAAPFLFVVSYWWVYQVVIWVKH